MLHRMFFSKIHRATVTHADLDYEGSCTIDAGLMEAARMLPWQEVHVWNITRGSRLVTYAMEGARGSGIICMNGAAAHHNRPGDLVILSTFAGMSEEEAESHVPAIVRVDAQNRIVEIRGEAAGPALKKAV